MMQRFELAYKNASMHRSVAILLQSCLQPDRPPTLNKIIHGFIIVKVYFYINIYTFYLHIRFHLYNHSFTTNTFVKLWLV